jgi:hypothetical protein
MTRRALSVLLLAAAATGLAGCEDFWGMCGPHIYKAEATAFVPVHLEGDNRTRFLGTLRELGFQPNDYGYVTAERGRDGLTAFDRDNGTEVQVWVEVRSKEFNSSDGARAYAERNKAGWAGRMQATYGEVLAAMGWAGGPLGPVDAPVTVC